MQRPASGPLVSVIVRTMGRPELPRALASVAAQTYRPLEVVLVMRRAPAWRRCPPATFGASSAQGRLAARKRPNAGLEGAAATGCSSRRGRRESSRSTSSKLVAAATKSGSEVAYSQTRLVDDAGRTQRIFGGPYNRAFLFRSNYLAITPCSSRAAWSRPAIADEAMTIFEIGISGCSSRQRAFAFTGSRLRVPRLGR